MSHFQDYENIYIITTYFDGVSSSKIALKILSEKQIKFFTACLIISLKNIREQKIIHRDLEFKNVVMDKENYFNLIDFSFSVDYSNRNNILLKCNIFRDFTPPEILNNSECDYNSDYYRLGYMIFYLVFKKYPWELNKFTNISVLIDEKNINGKYSIELFDFIFKLYKKDIKERLGYNSIYELINHPWFNGFNWKKLENKKINSPFNNIRFKRKDIICKAFRKDERMIQNYKKLIMSNSYIKKIKFFNF